MKQLWKMPLIALFAVFALVSFTLTVNATEKLPYEYEFKVTTATYNGFEGVKEMVVTFENDIPTTFNKNKIKLYQGNNEVPNVIHSVTGTGKQVTITFENLEFLNPSGEENSEYQIVIGKDANVVNAQLSAYTLPFNLHEILPGFTSVFIEGKPTTINNNIFKQNATYDVDIHVPTAYLTKIETIHRYSGVTQQTNEPNLTNIDVFADPGATRMKAWLGNQYDSTHENSRDLDYRADIKGFSMGQAGIDALVCSGGTNASCEQVNDFHLRAYDQYGKVLTNRSFKIRVNNKESDFKINDYIKSPAKVFGTTETLYNLMANQKLLEDILTQIPVEELDKLGVTYSLGNSIEVKNEEQLLMALANDYFKTIDLGNTVITTDVVVNRNVTIKGGTFEGDVVLGDGSENLTIRLDEVTVEGNLTIDVGADGTAIVSTSTADSTTILSGGVNSIHLHDFTSENGIVLENTTPVRIVMSHSNGSSIEKNMKMNLGSTRAVTLEGLDGELTVNVASNINAQLTVKNSKGSIAVGSEVPQGSLDLKVAQEVNTPSSDPTGWTVEELETVVEDGKNVVEKNYSLPLDKSKTVWQMTGEFLTLTELGLPEGFSPTVENPNVFGGQSEVIFENFTLKITGDPQARTENVILRDEIDGKIYKLKVTVTVNETDN